MPKTTAIDIADPVDTSVVITPAVTAGEMDRVIFSTKTKLDLQPKFKIRIRKDMGQDPKAPNYETVCVNGYLIQIRKGFDVEVPETVRDILAEAGLI